MIVLFYLLFFVISLFAFANKEKSKYFNSFYWLTGLILIIYAAFRDGEALADYNEYLRYYKEYKDILVEPTFYLICHIVHKTFNNPIFVFIVYAILGVSIKLTAIKQLSKLFFLSVLIYLSYYFILHELTQIRTGVASAMLLLCIKPLYERNVKRFLLYALIASFFHASAIIIFAFWFLNPFKLNRGLYALIIPAAYIAYFCDLNLIYKIPIPFIKEKLYIYQQSLDSQNINVFNLLHLTKCFILYYLLYFYRAIDKHNKYTIILIKLFAISLCCIPLFASLPTAAVRISELIGIVEIILLPFIYYTISPKIIPKTLILVIALVLSYILIFHGSLIH